MMQNFFCANWSIRLNAAILCCCTIFFYLFTSHLSYETPKVEEEPLPVLRSWPYIEVVIPADPGIWPYRAFKSSNWTPPNITITHRNGDLAEGYLILNPKSRGPGGSVLQSAPLIMTHDNELVYGYNESFGTGDLRVQTWMGKPHLTFWEGQSTVGHGYGSFVLLDEGYRQWNVDLDSSVAPIRWTLPSNQKARGMIDFHEHEITSRGTVYVSAYDHTPANLTSIHGTAEGWIADSLIYEIDILTGEILFRWSALDHLPLSASKLPLKTYMGNGSRDSPWDHFHLNSIQDLGDHLLISGRHTWAVYLINKEDGEVVWELSGSGEGGNFGPLPEEGQFRWAHDARAHDIRGDSTVISIFDNHFMMDVNETTPSRGLMLELQLPPNPDVPPRILRDIRSAEPIYSNSQGSYDPHLSNGNQLMCYGPVPMIREYGPATDGSDLRWEGRFGLDDHAQSYRAFKAEWHGTPIYEDPSLFVEGHGAAHDKRGFTLVQGFVSWNGATDIDEWNVYAGKGAKRENLEKVAAVVKWGFETTFKLQVPNRWCVQLGAVRAGEEIRRSNVACT